MIDINLDFSALNDIAKDLELLSRAENNKVLRDATRSGAEVFKNEVQRRAPEKTGKLKRNIVVVTQKGKQRGEISSGIHIRGTNSKGNNSNSKVKANSPRNAYYWRFVELGTVKMAPIPFIRTSFDAKTQEATDAAMRRMNQAIDEVLSK
ncbi:hypothetical protein EKN56_12610 [Limnobaculum zhutongyuii]|uniref:HK97 gp10 family phage protein n=1 Tax=Limnobaculum zhutongyuii TaxID=2498113 RepID=A0A411WLX7_9GAMM|nr:HK97-gp10 family putative phage morphogenesis protein [Limnobaculum zhutongyuii]QBH97160.1 hypothetical protein EKN56_12610 [Limnobaculum zhutongyuii]TQS88419.1 hypothetical protein ELQ32_10395 [Limnobaculum zhutongyuii]